MANRPTSFAEFQSLIEQIYGPEILAVRYEFFAQQNGRRRMRQAVSGIVNLFRELRWLLRPEPVADPRDVQVIAILTQARSIGAATLRPALEQVKASGLSFRVIRHPRVPARIEPAAAALRLVRPLSVIGPFIEHLPYLRRGHPFYSRLLAYTLMVRAGLLRAACLSSFGGFPGVLLLHCDSEVIGVAALDAIANRRRSICLQHGVMTDDFFPTRAEAQVVWGQSSADVAHSNGVANGRLTIDSLGRDRALADLSATPPARICLVSQTHTRMYGLDLRDGLSGLAKNLGRLTPNGTVTVLLHPEELRNHPYGRTDGIVVQSSPHPELQDAYTRQHPPCLIVGFSSTALLDAVAAGHYVIGLDWTPSASLGAFSVTRPPITVADAAEILHTFQRLGRDFAFRQDLVAAQGAWFRRTFQSRDRSISDGPFMQRLTSMLDQ